MSTLPELVKRIKNYHEFQVKQLEDHPEYGLNGDVRISTLTKLLSAMTGYQLSLIHSEIQLADKKWWEHYFGNQINDNDITIRTSSYNHISLIGFFHGFFMSLESSLRSVSIAIDPTRNNIGRAEFANIYNFIFNTLSIQKYIPLFDTLRLIRNTVHNNGLFIPIRSGDVSIIYKARTFQFIENLPVVHLNELDNNNLYFFLDETLEFLKEIFNHPDILSLVKIEERVV